MAKGKGSKEKPIVLNALAEATEALEAIVFQKRGYKIMEATIKDDLCNYSFEIIDGIGMGNQLAVKGKVGYVSTDMKKAFEEFNVHLAIRSDIFKHAQVNEDSFLTLLKHEFTDLFHVTGFKIKGSEENESVILIGTQYLNGGGRMELETPKISLDSTSGYIWYNELKATVDKARLEVSLYNEGKYTPIEIEEEEENSKQVTMTFEKKDEKDEEFDNAEV